MIEANRVSRHESTVRAALLPPLAGLAVLAVLLLCLVLYLLNANAALVRSNEVAFDLSRVMRLAVDMETGKRGYLLDGNPVFLAPYDAANKDIDAAFDKLVGDMQANSKQSERVRRMREQFEAWRTDAQADMREYRNAPKSQFDRSFSDAPGKVKMDAIRATFNETGAEVRRILAERVATVQNAIRVAVLGGGVAVLSVGLFIAATTRRHLSDLGTQYETALLDEAQGRERLATTLTSIGDGVIVTDAAGKITLINPVTESLTGWTNAEARGQDHQTVFDIFDETTNAPLGSPIAEVIRTNDIVLLANHAALKRRDGTQIAIEDSASPVRDKNGNVAGVVLVFRDVSKRKTQEAQLAAALAKNTQIAETLQRSMLISPGESAFPGLHFATVYEPAWDEAMVGGDFFDLFSYWTDCVALVVGDATGKGLEAAATTSEVKYALRAYLHDDPDPGIALTRLNRFLADVRKETGTDFVSPSFVALTVSVLNTRTGELSTASAGADVPLLLREGGDMVAAGDAGTMLGAASDSLFHAARFTMEAGDTLAMVTDGVTEARRGRREFFGYEGFGDAIKKASGDAATLDTIAQSVVADAKVFAGGRLHDDVCLLVARRAPLG